MTLCRTFFSFAFFSLFPLLASHSFALDLRRGFSALQEVTWTRQGNDQVGPGTQILRITPVGNHPASWPEELAREEQARRRAQARRAHTWSGFLGTQPAWSVDGEVLEGVPEKARIRRRLEFVSFRQARVNLCPPPRSLVSGRRHADGTRQVPEAEGYDPGHRAMALSTRRTRQGVAYS